MRLSALYRPVGAAAVAVALLTITPVAAGAAPGGRPGKPSPSPTPTSTTMPLVSRGTVSPATISAGQPATQTVTLSGPAPADGIWVSLYADVVYTTFVGSQVYVPAGRSSVSFPIRLSANVAQTQVRTLYAQAPGQGLVPAGTVTVVPADPAVQGIKDLRFDRRVVVEGQTVTGTVELTAPATAGGLNVDLSPNSAYGGVQVGLPQLAVVPEGATTVSFTVPVRGDGEPAEGNPSAHLGGTWDSAPVAAVPPTFAVGPGFVRVGSTVTGVVGIGTASNPDGARVALSVDLAGVGVPATVDIPAGSPGAVFPIVGAADLPPARIGTLTATWGGQTTTRSFVTGY
ncbi:hypothetical protein ABZ570_30900 [Micromonospora sp. NPDC007271]|uniref:hypothetical protein n=1 Tax=Micromonospora sp. NPDC007271 TaxID=3154587 RepID=UPI0033DF9EA4